VEEVQLEVHQEVKEREDLAVVEMRVALMEFQEFQEHLIQAGVEVELLMLVVQVQKIYPQVEQAVQELL
jgi:hypothetical protein